MDELVAVGTAGLAGLVMTALLLIGAVWWIASVLWNAFVSGQWQGIAEIFLVLLLAVAIYIGAGMWLQKTGRI